MTDTSSLVTFSRRRKEPKASAAGELSTADSLFAATASTTNTYVTAASVLTPVAESPLPGVDTLVASTAESEDSGGGKGRLRRRLAPSIGRARAASYAQHIADLKAYFEEVDAYELVVETPTPKKGQRLRPAINSQDAQLSENVNSINFSVEPQQQLGHPEAAASSCKLRPMSLGLSRRASIVARPRVSAAAHSVKEGAAQQGRSSLAQHRLSAVGESASAAVAGQLGRQSLLPVRQQSSRLSSHAGMAGGVMGRLSLGLADALQRLGLNGSLTTAQPSDLAGQHGAPHVQEVEPASSQAEVAEASSDTWQEAGSPASQPGSPAHVGSTAPNQLQSASAEPSDLPASRSTAVAPPLFSAADPARLPSLQHGMPTLPEEEAEDSLGQLLETKLVLQERQQQGSYGQDDSEEACPEGSQSPAMEDGQATDDLTPLQQLLLLCGQELDLGHLPSMEELLGQHVNLGDVRKIGEGTFGEAFKAGGVVFKIVPMEGQTMVNGEPQKRADEILAEAAITLTLSGLRGPSMNAGSEPQALPENATNGFVETYGVGVCRSRYAAQLQKEWHRWDEQFGSENDPVDVFGNDQLYVVYVVADGGLDLEHFELRSFDELRSILLQVCLTLAVAEEGCQFEHRDLHWGNLLIRRDGTKHVGCRLRGCDVKAQAAGVTVTLIDFTLSRLVAGSGEAVFCDLAADPALFKGPKGNVQAETYRRMKKATKNNWSTFAPCTNSLWVHYLADICLTHKLPAGCSSCDKHELRNFRKRALTYSCCAELLWDEFFLPQFLVASSVGGWEGDEA